MLLNVEPTLRPDADQLSKVSFSFLIILIIVMTSNGTVGNRMTVSTIYACLFTTKVVSWKKTTKMETEHKI